MFCYIYCWVKCRDSSGEYEVSSDIADICSNVLSWGGISEGVDGNFTKLQDNKW